MKLKRGLFAAALASALALATNGAHAADAYDWSGFYVGANASYAWGEAEWVYTTSGAPTAPRSQDTNGAIFGVQAGYQKQFGNYVVGVEVSGNWSSDIDGKADCPNVSYSCNVNDVSDLYIVGPRLGYAMNNWLISLNGGYATARVKTETPLKATGVPYDNSSKRHNGWALGAGVEFGFTKNITFGINYSHVDLNSENHVSSTSPGIEDRDIEPNFDIVTARISYAFH